MNWLLSHQTSFGSFHISITTSRQGSSLYEGPTSFKTSITLNSLSYLAAHHIVNSIYSYSIYLDGKKVDLLFF